MGTANGGGGGARKPTTPIYMMLNLTDILLGPITWPAHLRLRNLKTACLVVSLFAGRWCFMSLSNVPTCQRANVLVDLSITQCTHIGYIIGSMPTEINFAND